MLSKLVLAACIGLAAGHNDWGEKCPDPLHMEETENATFNKYSGGAKQYVLESDVIRVYSDGIDDADPEDTEFQAKAAFKQMDLDNDGKITEKEFYTAGMTQSCVGPKKTAQGGCPSPYILDGEKEFFLLASEHYELRKLHWHQMVEMTKDELRGFLRSHEVPYTVRIKVLDLHDHKGGSKNEECVPVPPLCHGSLEYHEDGTCRPPKPHFMNPIINDAWVQPTLVVDGAHHNEKAPRAHQPVENDPNDNVMIKERHTEENNLWNWEKVRKHTAN
jgi:hypothetical protein